MTATAEHPPPRTQAMVAAAVAPIVMLGIVVTAVLVVLLGVWGLALGLVATAVVVWLRARSLTHGIRDRVLAQLGARPADPTADARLVNLAEGLSATSGVALPELFVVDDPAANLLVVGEGGVVPAVVATTGLLGALAPVQLEGAVAWAFAELRSGELPAASVAVATAGRAAPGAGAGAAGGVMARPFQGLVAGYTSLTDPDRDLLLDQAAVALTRYPPGLRGALEQLRAVGTAVQRPDPSVAHLWMADPGASRAGTPARPPLDLRIEALRLL